MASSETDLSYAGAAASALRGSSRPLRIVHTVSSLVYGGMETFAIRLARAQKACGHDVAILALRGGPLLANAVNSGIKVTALQSEHRPVRFAQGIAFIAGHHPDIVHAHNSTSLHFAAAGRIRSHSKLVFTDHGASIWRQPSRWEIHATDAAVAVSQQTATDHRSSYRSLVNFQVIRNGVDFEPASDTRAEVRKRLNLSPEPVGIIVARLEPVKNHAMLLQALAALEQSGRPVNLLVAGDGTERARLEALACELGISRRVHFLGFRTDVCSLLDAADFFVLSSRDEGLPLSLLEAMSHGLPIISTSVGGVPEVVANGVDGLLVPDGDEQAMAHAIDLLSHDETLRGRIGAAGRRHVQQAFSFERTASEYEALYYKLQSA